MDSVNWLGGLLGLRVLAWTWWVPWASRAGLDVVSRVRSSVFQNVGRVALLRDLRLTSNKTRSTPI